MNIKCSLVNMIFFFSSFLQLERALNDLSVLESIVLWSQNAYCVKLPYCQQRGINFSFLLLLLSLPSHRIEFLIWPLMRIESCIFIQLFSTGNSSPMILFVELVIRYWKFWTFRATIVNGDNKCDKSFIQIFNLLIIYGISKKS